MTTSTFICSALLALSLLASGAGAQQAVQQTPPADNTRTNVRDQQPGAVTADRQKMNRSDEETARRIRRLVVTDKSLSLYAHNAKVIVRDGTVTLRGPVRSAEEKDAVARKAISVAGEDKVINELEVAPRK